MLLFKSDSADRLLPVLNGGAAGVMTAAGVWSLIIPGLEYSQSLGSFSFLPVSIGFFGGIIFMLPVEKAIAGIEKRFLGKDNVRGKNLLSFFAVTLHNFPEGLAVGMAFAAAIKKPELLPSAVMLSGGIALQNIPEGAIVSLPMLSKGRGRAFLWGAVSGMAEPLAAVAALFFSSAVEAVLPLFMGFAAGAMMFVVMGELAGEMKQGGSFARGIVSFGIGFCIMMSMDVALG